MIKAEWTKADALDLQPTCNEVATDTISRRALCEYALNQKDKTITANDIMRFPSAQPAPEEFEWCRDCKEYDQTAHCCHRWTKAIRKTVEELETNAFPSITVVAEDFSGLKRSLTLFFRVNDRNFDINVLENVK